MRAQDAISGRDEQPFESRERLLNVSETHGAPDDSAVHVDVVSSDVTMPEPGGNVNEYPDRPAECGSVFVGGSISTSTAPLR
jgi:hypothetical protein